ncbi:guanylate kinase [Anaeromyxobacter diazotrophicus]|uniref:guanylate kinase n=1 Tax=Anaeromyxobacter diazotrophicus TaxID=2590199 RepID=UPI0035315336
MDPSSPGLLLVLSAPSGAGKTTLARLFLAGHPEARFSVSATTRAPRGAERDGVDYHFVTRDRFAELVAADALAEWAEVHGQRYGTLRDTVEESLAAGRVAVFDIDVQGGAQVKARWPGQAATVFVLPPSLEELERRLRTRSTDPDAAIARRLGAARSEIERGLAQYEYVIVNDELAAAQRQLEAIVAHERARLAGRRDEAASALAEAVRRERVDPRRWLR